MTGRRAVALLAAVAALALGSCGGGGDGGDGGGADLAETATGSTVATLSTTAAPTSGPAPTSAPAPTTAAGAGGPAGPTGSAAPAADGTGTAPPAPTGDAAGSAAASDAGADTTAASDPAPPGTTSTASAAPLRYEGPDGFVAMVAPIDAAVRARMEPTSWRPGCPVGLDELRYLQLGYIGFDGAGHLGELVVHADAADAMVTVFQRLWTARFPIRQLRLVDDFGGDDFTSIEADNTSAFNCRYVAGTTRWSNHATGRAIDVNPLENPYVSGGTTDHAASVPYLGRDPALPGVIVEGGAAVAAFDEVGWGWGGRWSGDLDYQHFSANGS